jgi:hypothetical protein
LYPRSGAPQLSINPLAAPGVYHSAELYYVFNTLGVREWPWEWGNSRPGVLKIEFCRI